MRHIGILAHSADGAALCFLEVVREVARVLGPHRLDEIARARGSGDGDCGSIT
jgi:hypothetical protein